MAAGALLIAPASLVARDGETVVPAGTAINVRMVDSINSSVNYASQTFRGVIDNPVRVGNRTVIPQGANAYVRLVDVESGGRIKGRSELVLQLDRIAFNGYTYPVASQALAFRGRSEGKNTGKKTGIGAAVGGGLGALFGGGKGAAIGAGIGAGTGLAASAAGEGRSIQISSESVVQFKLAGPLYIRG